MVGRGRVCIYVTILRRVTWPPSPRDDKQSDETGGHRAVRQATQHACMATMQSAGFKSLLPLLHARPLVRRARMNANPSLPYCETQPHWPLSQRPVATQCPSAHSISPLAFPSLRHRLEGRVRIGIELLPHERFRADALVGALRGSCPRPEPQPVRLAHHRCGDVALQRPLRAAWPRSRPVP